MSLGAAALAAAALLAWWPRGRPAPETLFRERCATCHELPALCGYSPAERAGIVATMRSRQGADAVIDEREAGLIARYLKESLPCP